MPAMHGKRVIVSSTAAKTVDEYTAAVLEAAYWKGVVEDTYLATNSEKARAIACQAYREAVEAARQAAETVVEQEYTQS